jgi:hypothetical protein
VHVTSFYDRVMFRRSCSFLPAEHFSKFCSHYPMTMLANFNEKKEMTLGEAITDLTNLMCLTIGHSGQ